jgi:hypothetical protein
MANRGCVRNGKRKGINECNRLIATVILRASQYCGRRLFQAEGVKCLKPANIDYPIRDYR